MALELVLRQASGEVLFLALIFINYAFLNTLYLSVDGSICSSFLSGDLPLSRVDLSQLERRLKDLEDENGALKSEHQRLQLNTEKYEDVEQGLVKDCVKQLGESVVFLSDSMSSGTFSILLYTAEANCHIKSMSEDLNRKTDLYIRQQEEITNLLAKTIDQDNRIKRVSFFNINFEPPSACCFLTAGN